MKEKYLFYDIETTGLPIEYSDSIENVNNWPRLVQIACLLYDSTGNELESESLIIKPDGFIIPESASNIHRITQDRAIKEGVELKPVLDMFQSHLLNSNYMVAHNIYFDRKIVGAEFIRNGIDPTRIREIPRLCTMQKSTKYCQLPGKRGYKWPKLSELYYVLFKENFEDAHDALADIRATAKCFWRMRELNLI